MADQTTSKHCEKMISHLDMAKAIVRCLDGFDASIDEKHAACKIASETMQAEMSRQSMIAAVSKALGGGQ